MSALNKKMNTDSKVTREIRVELVAILETLGGLQLS